MQPRLRQMQRRLQQMQKPLQQMRMRKIHMRKKQRTQKTPQQKNMGQSRCSKAKARVEIGTFTPGRFPAKYGSE